MDLMKFGGAFMRNFILILACFLFVLPSLAQGDAYQIALQRIEEARLTNAETLYLDGLHLTELPPEIGQLGELRVLILSANELSTLPPEIGQLRNLQELNLSINSFSSLPTVI